MLRLLLAIFYAKVHNFINNTLGIKHIIQFTLGLAAGSLALNAAYSGRLVNMILILVIFSMVNQVFHSKFKPIRVARVVVNKDEDKEERED